jgi:hypothetical protein
MPYNITKSDGTPLVTVPDNKIDTSSSSLSLIGRNALNFGQAIDQNFINLMQNFANTNAPSMPLDGQLWYDTSNRILKIYNNSTISWTPLYPAFTGSSGLVTTKIGPSNSGIAITIADQKIISVTSYVRIVPAQLPDTIVLNDTRYQFKLLFPGGLQPGINLATDVANLRFVGTATNADALRIPRTIELQGAIVGSVKFDGTSNVIMGTSFSNVFIGNTNVTIGGTYTKVRVDDTGRVINGGNVTNADIIQALGYTPYSGANINVFAQGNTIVARDGNGNFEANIMVGTSTSAHALSKPIMIGINGDIVGAVSFDGTSDVVIDAQLAPISNLTAGSYSTVRVDAKGRVIAGSVTADAPLGGIIINSSRTVIPHGWAPCDGTTIQTPTGDFITTPNFSNVVIGTSACIYIMKIF